MGRLGSTVARLKLKGIGGGAHKGWRLRFNWTQRREPYQRRQQVEGQLEELPDTLRSGAWPSSVRVVRCPVKSGNEQDPRPMLLRYTSVCRHSWGTAGDKPEEGAVDGRSVCSESSGLHAAYNGWDNGMQHRKVELISKPSLSSDRGLQLALVKPKSLVVAG